MRSFLLVLCFVAFISKASGQQVYAEFDVESNRVDDIQAIPVGDSLFLTYTDKNIRKSFWVDATGQTAPVYFPHVEHLRFLAIERHDDTTYFYYLKKEDNFLKLYTLKQTPES